MATENATGPSTIKYYTRAEVAKYNEAKSAWIIIHDKVYDVTNFVNQHPGGEEVVLEYAGKDGTEPFEDIGHSSDARKMMEPYKIGELVEEERTSNNKKDRSSVNGDSSGNSFSGSGKSWLIPILFGVLVTVVYRYFISTH